MTDHPSLDELADLAEGIQDNPGISEHAAACATCGADLERLSAVTAELAALPPEPLPGDVADRIDRALRDARPGVTGGTVVPLAAPRRPRVPSWVAAAAVAVVAVGGSAILVASGVFDGLGSSKAPQRTQDTASAPSITRLASSGVDYTATSLPTLLPSLLAGTATAHAGAGPASPAPMEANRTTSQAAKDALSGATQLAALKDERALAQCLITALGTDVGTPLAVDLARYAGRPAVVAAYPDLDHPDRVDVYVLSPSCPANTFVYWARLPRPAAK